MPKGNLILICQSGGKFSTADDGSLSYKDGDAHAMSVNHQTNFDELRSEMAEMWNYDPDSFTIRYLLPSNKRTLITVSSDKDIKRMIDFHEDTATVDLYVIINENSTSEASIIPRTRSSWTTAAEGSSPLMDTDAVSIAVDAQPLNSLSIVAAEVEDEGQHKFLKLWENCITGLHQRFNNVSEVRDALRKYSIAHGFKYTMKKNDCRRVSAKCKVEGCPWRIYVSRLSTTHLFQIKKLNEMHTCGAGSSATHRPQASRKLLASILKEKLCNTPNFRPKEIANQIRQEFGIELKYAQAWRGMETARKELHGSDKEAYNQLPWLCKKIVETNPGSVATLITREDLSFHRLFITLHASIYGFQMGCRPLLFLDTMTLKSKYQSELLTATALDGNSDIFPLAFSIVDVVNDDNWCWFLVQLKSALSTLQSITFVADRQMGLRQSISLVFEDSYHGHCLCHLSEELKEDLKGACTQEIFNVIVTDLFDAAHAATLDGYRNCIERIRSISPEAFEWILQSKPEHWANSLFEGSRYNHVMSGIAESFYSWVAELPVLPVLQIIDTIRQKIMELIYTGKVGSDRWLTRLTPSWEDKLQKHILMAKSLQVLSSSSTPYEVHDCLGAINVVNVEAWDCSCGEWKINDFPCVHAVAVLLHLNRNLYDYCSKYYTAETFRITYSQSVNPVPTADKPAHGESLPVQVNPPPLRHLSGFPKKRRIRSKGLIKRPLHCSKCKGAGHNRATCHLYS